MQIIGLARLNLVGYVLCSHILMLFTTTQGNKWGPDVFSHVVRWSQASWSVGCWPVQQGETEAAYLPSRVVPLGFVLREMMSVLGHTVFIQTRSGSPNVLLAGLIWEKEFCSWSLLHDIDLLKTAVHLMSVVEHSGLHPQMSSCHASVFRSVVLWLNQREGPIWEETTPWGSRGNSRR